METQSWNNKVFRALLTDLSKAFYRPGQMYCLWSRVFMFYHLRVQVFLVTIYKKRVSTKQRNTVKFDRTRKLWYLLLLVFWLLLTNFNFRNDNGVSLCLQPNLRFFLSSLISEVPEDPKYKVVQQLYQVCHTRFQVSFYLWRMGPVLKIRFQNFMTRIADKCHLIAHGTGNAKTKHVNFATKN